MVSPRDRRKSWARHYIAQAPQGPIYGSAEWLALPDGPEKVAAVVRAAECWLTEAEDNLTALRTEHLSRALAAKRAGNAAYVAQRDEWRREYSGKSWRPHPANRGAA